MTKTDGTFCSSTPILLLSVLSVHMSRSDRSPIALTIFTSSSEMPPKRLYAPSPDLLSLLDSYMTIEHSRLN